jgi:outer membrane protein
MRCMSVVFLIALLSLASIPARSETLTLPDGLRIVTEESRIVRIREQEERMSRADADVARSRLLPGVVLSFGNTMLAHQPGVRFGPASAPTAERNSYTYRLAVEQLLYDFGGVSSFYKGARLIEETKRLETKRTKHAVALDFSLLYFDVLQSEKLIAVAEKEVDSLSAHLRVATELLRDGLITRNDVLQAEVRLADTRQKLLNAENTRKIAAAAVNSMLTRPLSSPVQVAEPPRREVVLPEDEEASAIAEKERPELQVVDTAVEALRLEEAGHRSGYRPQFFAQGWYDYTQNRYVTHEENAGITLLMRYNLFNGGSTTAEVRKTEAARTRLAIERKRLAEEIRLELRKEYLEMANARERVTVTEKAISQAEENLRITRLKYREGLGIATDVTDAIALRSLSETNYYRALYDRYRSEARYRHAMGKNPEDEYGGD